MAQRRERVRKGEEHWLDWVCRADPHIRKRIRVGPGDDGAVVAWSKGNDLVVTTDHLVEGIHFDLDTASPGAVGYKAMACNLSDIAAMGCHPVAATIHVAVPPHVTMAVLRRIYRGMRRAADPFDTAIVGGDTSASPRHLVVGATLIGETRGLRPLRRDGARIGDVILVTGRLGGSILGRHLRFLPRVEEGLRLNRRYRIHSMIDLSDGLSTDLYRVLRASDVGAVLDAARIPVSSAARRRARDSSKSPLRHALDDGEDFELLFTAAERETRRIESDRVLGPIVSRIGRIVPSGFVLRDRAGRERPLEPSGYEHEIRED
jgi:thiamine-monophosphate kinase